jgi:hypothetical protein
MEGFLRAQVPFQLVVESTSCYEWFVELAEPLADRVVLAHPRKLRVIAESTRKTDRLDAQVLAEFLALGMIPEAHRAPPRLREHRTLVRHRCFLKRRFVYERLKQRRGAKRAIVAVARRLLGVIVSLLRSGKPVSRPSLMINRRICSEVGRLPRWHRVCEAIYWRSATGTACCIRVRDPNRGGRRPDVLR